MIIYGCIPSSTNGLASFNNSAAKRVTDVVPSPTSSSYAFAISTKTLAAGCTMSRSWRIVAPSFEMVVLFP